jgi:integrase
VKKTKTRTTRSFRLLAPLSKELKALRLRRWRPGDEELIFPRLDGEPWRDTDWRNWRRRVFQPAAEAAGLEAIRPYDLRHSFVSLLIAERRSIVVAHQAGHSPSMALKTYGHVFDELEDAEPASTEEMIRAARATLVRPPRQNVGSQVNKNSA